MLIDWAKVEELCAEIGAGDFADIVEIFLEEVDGTIAALRGGKNRQGLEETLHFLKGSALNLGFGSFAALCQSGETLARQGEKEAVDLAAIIATYDESRARFLEGLARHTAG